MHNTDRQKRHARKQHVCTWCGQPIEVGTLYHTWTTFDDSAFVSKMHPECDTACADECHEMGDWEYLPYDNERPATMSNQPKEAEK